MLGNTPPHTPLTGPSRHIKAPCKQHIHLPYQGSIGGGGGGGGWGGGQGGFDPPLRISGGDIPPLFFLIQKETCHQGIINSGFC